MATLPNVQFAFVDDPLVRRFERRTFVGVPRPQDDQVVSVVRIPSEVVEEPPPKFTSGSVRDRNPSKPLSGKGKNDPAANVHLSRDSKGREVGSVRRRANEKVGPESTKRRLNAPRYGAYVGQRKTVILGVLSIDPPACKNDYTRAIRHRARI